MCFLDNVTLSGGSLLMRTSVEPGAVAHTFNPSPHEAEARGSV